jgi:lambda family phage minor tail protein L
MVDTVNSEIQQSEVSPYVILWELDLTDLGDTVYHFVQGTLDPSPVQFDGVTYSPFDVEADGFEWNGTGQPATPTLKFSTTDAAVSTLINEYNDLCGAKVTRTRTFRKFLDGEPSASPGEYFTLDVYYINTKTMEDKRSVSFELSSFLDQQGTMLPRGQITTYCRAIYRKWNGSSFIIHPSDIACPWATATYYTEDNVSTTAANDRCNHLVSGCKQRFGATAELPFMAFPGTAKPTLG